MFLNPALNFMSYYVTQARTRARYNIYSVVLRVTNGRVSRLGPSEIYSRHL